MSERSKEFLDTDARTIPSELPARRDVAEVDTSGLVRAIELLASGNLKGDALVALLRHELASAQRQARDLTGLLQTTSMELRQLRESAQRDQLQRIDEQRQLQDQNDRFVASLMQDHEAELITLRRERDAAIDRVRELSRGITRVASTSSASQQRAPLLGSARTHQGQDNTTELRARIDELLHERERSLRLLRQLAEQRDVAEHRLQETLAAIGQATSPTAAGHALLHAQAIQRMAVPTSPTEPLNLAPRQHPAGPDVALTSGESTSTRTATMPTAANATESGLGAFDATHASTAGDDARDSGTPAQEAHSVEVEPRQPQDLVRGLPMSALPRNARARTDRIGAYTLRAEDFAAEEVFAPRRDPPAPKNS